MSDAEESPDELIGRRLGHYLVVDAIGRGAMGHVFRAWDVVLRRSVALKVHRNKRSETGLRRFLQESRASSTLSHPGIAEIYESGQSGAYHFLAMELIEGLTLGDLIGRGPLGWEAAVAIGREIASALGYAHRHGVVHRDLKPTNVILSHDGRVKLVDFGLAKQIAMPEPSESESTIFEWSDVRTAAGAVLGTPAYMSPEQARAKPIDARADIFALGIVLSELIDARPVFRRASPAATIGAILTQRPQRIDVLNPEVPGWVADVIARCLEKSADARFADGSELLFALDAEESPRVDLATLGQPGAEARLPSVRAPSVVASLRSISLAPPSASARFIGRIEELERLRVGIVHGERAIVISGPAGAGKTRLVREHLLDRGTQDTAIIELAGVRSEEDFLLACALGLRLREHDRAHAGLLRRLVDRRLKLVVLDGLDEALPFAASILRSWREGTTGTTFVVTSRAPLAIEGGLTILLAGLPVPEGTELFLERAMSGARDPVALLEHGATASRIVEHLGGIPLAIELAAARAESVGPDALLAEIAHDLEWVDPERRDEGPVGLDAVLDASIRRLDPDTRSALLSLAVLPTFDRAGAGAVTGLVGANIETLVARLVSLSLAHPSPHPELLSEARWAIREPVRRRAEETLAREGRRHAALEKAARHLGESARAHREALATAPSCESFRDILADAPSYLAIAEAAVREPVETIQLAALEGILAYAQVATREEAEARAAPLLEPLLDRLLARAGSDTRLLGDALVTRGWLRLSRGEPMAIADADRALAMANESASLPHEARARSLRAAALLARSSIAPAMDEAERATDAARRSGSAADLTHALERVAECSLGACDLARAGQAAHEARVLAQERGDMRARARLAVVLGEVRRELGDDDGAREHLLEALDLSNATGQLDRTPLVLLALGELAHGAGELDAARETYARAISLCPTDTRSLADARISLALAQLEMELGNAERALAILATLVDELPSIGASPRLEALALATRAATLAGADEPSKAREQFEHAAWRARDLDAVLRAAIDVWTGHEGAGPQASAAEIERARERLARAVSLREGALEANVAPGSRHALTIAVRVLEAVLPRRLSLIP